MDAGKLAITFIPVLVITLPSMVLFNVSPERSWQRVLAVFLFIIGLAIAGLILYFFLWKMISGH